MRGSAHDVPEASQRRTLDDLLASGQQLPLERALALVRGAALAVDALHARRVTHGALQPASFHVDAVDRVTLLPPGEAPGGPERPVPATSAGVGSDPARAYWSPQRRVGEPPRNADDLYALGLIAANLLSGHGSPKIDAVLLAQRAWSPSERFASGAALASELDRASARTIRSHEPAWAAARRVAQARAAHRLALSTPPSHRPRRRTRPASIPSHPILRRSNYPDMPMAGRWVAVVVAVLCSVYLFPLFYMLFPHG